MGRSEADGDVLIDHMWIVIRGLRVEIRISSPGEKIKINGRSGSARIPSGSWRMHA